MALLAIVLSCGGSSAAMAQVTSAAETAEAQALNRAAFAAPAEPSFDSGLVQWNSSRLALGQKAAATLDTVDISVGRLALGPSGLPAALYGGDLDDRTYRVTMTRQWPGLVSFGAAGMNFEVSPHAGVGVDSFGGSSATAGATVGLSRSEIAGQRLKSLGVADGRVFGDRGRFYLFAAASGRSVGLNMLHNDSTGWSRAGWSTDPTSRLTGDQQLGFGWMKGPVQTSLGYVHRSMKNDFVMHGVDPRSESMVALSFAIRRH